MIALFIGGIWDNQIKSIPGWQETWRVEEAARAPQFYYNDPPDKVCKPIGNATMHVYRLSKIGMADGVMFRMMVIESMGPAETMLRIIEGCVHPNGRNHNDIRLEECVEEHPIRPHPEPAIEEEEDQPREFDADAEATILAMQKDLQDIRDWQIDLPENDAIDKLQAKIDKLTEKIIC